MTAVSASSTQSSEKSVAAVTMQAGLVPNSYVGMGNDGTGCFQKGTGVSLGMPSSFLRLLSATCLQDSQVWASDHASELTPKCFAYVAA